MADGKENYYNRDLESERVKLKIEHVTFPLSKGSDVIKEEGSCKV